jgi:hypothetical protein
MALFRGRLEHTFDPGEQRTGRPSGWSPSTAWRRTASRCARFNTVRKAQPSQLTKEHYKGASVRTRTAACSTSQLAASLLEC